MLFETSVAENTEGWQYWKSFIYRPAIEQSPPFKSSVFNLHVSSGVRQRPLITDDEDDAGDCSKARSSLRRACFQAAPHRPRGLLVLSHSPASSGVATNSACIPLRMHLYHRFRQPRTPTIYRYPVGHVAGLSGEWQPLSPRARVPISPRPRSAVLVPAEAAIVSTIASGR